VSGCPCRREPGDEALRHRQPRGGTRPARGRGLHSPAQSSSRWNFSQVTSTRWAPGSGGGQAARSPSRYSASRPVSGRAATLQVATSALAAAGTPAPCRGAVTPLAEGTVPGGRAHVRAVLVTVGVLRQVAMGHSVGVVGRLRAPAATASARGQGTCPEGRGGGNWCPPRGPTGRSGAGRRPAAAPGTAPPRAGHGRQPGGAPGRRWGRGPAPGPPPAPAAGRSAPAPPPPAPGLLPNPSPGPVRGQEGAEPAPCTGPVAPATPGTGCVGPRRRWRTPLPALLPAPSPPHPALESPNPSARPQKKGKKPNSSRSGRWERGEPSARAQPPRQRAGGWWGAGGAPPVPGVPWVGRLRAQEQGRGQSSACRAHQRRGSRRAIPSPGHGMAANPQPRSPGTRRGRDPGSGGAAVLTTGLGGQDHSLQQAEQQPGAGAGRRTSRHGAGRWGHCRGWDGDGKGRFRALGPSQQKRGGLWLRRSGARRRRPVTLPWGHRALESPGPGETRPWGHRALGTPRSPGLEDTGSWHRPPGTGSSMAYAAYTACEPPGPAPRQPKAQRG